MNTRLTVSAVQFATRCYPCFPNLTPNAVTVLEPARHEDYDEVI